MAHVIEHLPGSMLMHHLQEMYRCFRVGEIFQIGGPNGDCAIRKFELAKVGPRPVVVKDVISWIVVAGNSAKIVKQWNK
jgi:hypothetical protein